MSYGVLLDPSVRFTLASPPLAPYPSIYRTTKESIKPYPVRDQNQEEAQGQPSSLPLVHNQTSLCVVPPLPSQPPPLPYTVVRMCVESRQGHRPSPRLRSPPPPSRARRDRDRRPNRPWRRAPPPQSGRARRTTRPLLPHSLAGLFFRDGAVASTPLPPCLPPPFPSLGGWGGGETSPRRERERKRGAFSFAPPPPPVGTTVGRDTTTTTTKGGGKAE